MEFLEHLHQSKESKKEQIKIDKLYKKKQFGIPMNFRRLEPIMFKNGLTLSIQASEFTYCTPRTYLEDLGEYTSMEMALIQNGEFVRVSSVLPNFIHIKEIEEHEEQVYSFVPVELLESLFQSLKGVYGLSEQIYGIEIRMFEVNSKDKRIRLSFEDGLYYVGIRNKKIASFKFNPNKKIELNILDGATENEKKKAVKVVKSIVDTPNVKTV